MSETPTKALAVTPAPGSSLKLIGEQEKKEMWDQAGIMIKAGLFPSKFSRPEQAFAAALYGRELGLSPQRAWKVIHLIEGMPCLEAHQQVTFAKLAIPGLNWGIVAHTDEICTIEHGRPGGKLYQTSFTFEEAKLMGKTGPTSSGKPSNWMKHRRDMLYARAATRAIKWYYPETQGGLVHSVEELREVVEETSAEARETGAPRSPKAAPAEETTQQEAPPELEEGKIEDPAAIEELGAALGQCENKNDLDLAYGSWRTKNKGKAHTLLEGYEMASRRLYALAHPGEEAPTQQA